jgi:enoyl-CoA hydratase/carnithine racemase
VIQEEAEIFSARLRSPEATEAFQAFFQKRAPDFSKFE